MDSNLTDDAKRIRKQQLALRREQLIRRMSGFTDTSTPAPEPAKPSSEDRILAVLSRISVELRKANKRPQESVGAVISPVIAKLGEQLTGVLAEISERLNNQTTGAWRMTVHRDSGGFIKEVTAIKE